jgi:hypothetical protein
MSINLVKPSIRSWRLWGGSMKIWAIKKDLKRPLDKWYKSGKDLHSKCHSYYNYKLNSLYIRTSEGYIRYTQDKE